MPEGAIMYEKTVGVPAVFFVVRLAAHAFGRREIPVCTYAVVFIREHMRAYTE